MVDRRSKDNSHLIVGLRASYYRIRNVIMSRPHEAKTRQVVSELRATARARAHTHTQFVQLAPKYSALFSMKVALKMSAIVFA